METLDTTPAFEPDSEGSTPNIFDALGTDFNLWQQEIEMDSSLDIMTTVKSTPSSGHKPDGTETSIDFDWD